MAMFVYEDLDDSKYSFPQSDVVMTISIGLAVSILAVAFGIFSTISPVRAANIFASGRLERLPPQDRILFLRCYRAFGMILCVGGTLFALDSLGFW